MAGLGEKKITITDVDCSAQELREHITMAFPKLSAGGGFEYLKCAPSTRKLEVIPFAIGNCACRLRAWIGNAKIYIRPMQINLDLSTSEEFDDTNAVRERTDTNDKIIFLTIIYACGCKFETQKIVCCITLILC